MKYLFIHGVENDPPKDFVEDHREYFPEANLRDMKYLWIGSLVDQDPEDISMLSEAITGQLGITEAGLEKATASFPDDGERDGHPDVPAGETTGSDQLLPGV